MITTLLLLGSACFPQTYTNKSGHDTAVDSGSGDTDTDTDSDSDSDSDADTDTGADSGTDTSIDTGTDTGTDTGADTSADTGGDTSFGIGDLWVSEFMANPHPIDDTLGEWIELRNTTTKSLDLKGLSIADLDATLPQVITIDAHVILPAEGYVVIGNSADTASNGGVDVAWAWDPTVFQLGNDGDEIVLSKGATTFDSVAYDEGAWAMVKGSTAQRDEDHLDASSGSDPTMWCAGVSTYGSDGQFGTPGSTNDDCGK